MYSKEHYRIACIFHDMKQRCYNKNDSQYKNYGGRGITVCDEWLSNPKIFFEWAFKNGYDKDAPRGKCMIDRIDNNKGYSPDNCRFVTNKEQQNNKRTNHLVNVNDETMTLTQALEKYGTCKTTFRNRIKRGISESEAITMKVPPNGIIPLKVAQVDDKGNVVRIFEDRKSAAAFFNTTADAICRNCIGKTKTCAGFKFRYVERKPNG